MKDFSKLLLVLFIFVGCDSDTTAPVDRSIAQHPSGIVGKDIFYSSMWRSANDIPPISEGGIYSLNYDGSGYAFLYKDALLYSAPRDTQLVFSIGRSVYLGNTKGASYRTLFTNDDKISYAILSPDAKKVLYATKGAVDSLNIFDLTSNTSYALIPPAWNMLSGDYPVFSDDSKKILFVLKSYTNSTDLLLINVDGSDKQVLASNAEFNFFNHMGDFIYQSFDFAPDGKKCTYVSVQPNSRRALTLLDMQSGEQEVIDSSGASGAWSPLGTFISFGQGDSCVFYNPATKQRSLFGVPNYGGIYDWALDEQKCIGVLDNGGFSDTSLTLALFDISTNTIERSYGLHNVVNCYRARRLGEH